MASQTFLQLCQATSREAGVAGGASVPTAVTGQTDEELLRIIDYVKQSWVEVQNFPQSKGQLWRWMRVGFTLTTVASTGEYAFGSSAIVDDETSTQIARFRKWLINDDYDPPKIYLNSSGVGSEHYMEYLDWDHFKSKYRLGTQNDGFPHHISINPQNELVLGPEPDAVYIVTGDFLRGAQNLSVNGDTPDMPGDYHDLIVFKALTKYGLYESAPECITRGEHEGGKYMDALVADQLSEILMAGPLDEY